MTLTLSHTIFIPEKTILLNLENTSSSNAVVQSSEFASYLTEPFVVLTRTQRRTCD